MTWYSKVLSSSKRRKLLTQYLILMIIKYLSRNNINGISQVLKIIYLIKEEILSNQLSQTNFQDNVYKWLREVNTLMTICLNRKPSILKV